MVNFSGHVMVLPYLLRPTSKINFLLMYPLMVNCGMMLYRMVMMIVMIGNSHAHDDSEGGGDDGDDGGWLFIYYFHLSWENNQGRKRCIQDVLQYPHKCFFIIHT